MRPRLLDPRVQIDEVDLPLFVDRSVYVGANGYAYFSTNATGPITVHSHILGGTVPGRHIDHVNGDKLDNRRVNLRVVTYQKNQVNRQRLNANNVSGMRGVARVGASKVNPWRAQITVNRRNIHLGLFPTAADALAARHAAELEHFGEVCP